MILVDYAMDEKTKSQKVKIRQIDKDINRQIPKKTKKKKEKKKKKKETKGQTESLIL